jgi:hypothetical protein
MYRQMAADREAKEAEAKKPKGGGLATGLEDPFREAQKRVRVGLIFACIFIFRVYISVIFLWSLFFLSRCKICRGFYSYAFESRALFLHRICAFLSRTSDEREGVRGRGRIAAQTAQSGPVGVLVRGG